MAEQLLAGHASGSAGSSARLGNAFMVLSLSHLSSRSAGAAPFGAADMSGRTMEEKKPPSGEFSIMSVSVGRVAFGALAVMLVTGLSAGAPLRATAQLPATGSAAVPRFSVNDVRVDEAAGAATFAVSISAAVDATVTYSTVDGTAGAPDDYAALPPTPLIFSALGPTSQLVSVPVAGDPLREAFETFSLQLDLASAGAVISDDTGTATIVDDDGLPAQLSVRDVPSVAEGGNATFTLAVDGIADQPAVVSYTTARGTAASPGDFKPTTGSVTLNPGPNPSASVVVPVVNDTVAEGNESFSLKVTAATNLTVVDAVGTALIAANDGGTGSPSTAPRVSVSDVRVPEDGGPAVFTVSLTSPANATVRYATPAALATAVAPRDFTSKSGQLTFSAGGPTTATVSVPITSDLVREFFEVVRLKLSSPSGAVIADNLGTATIVDADGLPPQLVVSDVEFPVAEGGSAGFVVSLANSPDETVTATVTTVPGSASTADYGSPTPSTISFPANTATPTVSVSVPVTEDGLGEPTETFSLRVTTATNADLADPVGTAVIDGSAAASDPVIAAAGDIACDPADGSFNAGGGTATACRQGATSNLLLDGGLAGVLSLGDHQYSDGALAKFQASYDPSWGRARALTHPAVGNHEYQTAGAAGYYNYFGAAAGDPTKGYYSFDIGAWHLIALNSECTNVPGGCGPGSPQEQWLRADLAANPNSCTLAYWHQPRFSSGRHGSRAAYDAFWQALHAAGAEIVLNGHDHDYERFAPQTAAGVADPGTGIREFMVGTGGAEHYPDVNVVPNSELRNGDTFGVLRLTLHPGSYDWEFMPEAGQTFTDSGSSTCH